MHTVGDVTVSWHVMTIDGGVALPSLWFSSLWCGLYATELNYFASFKKMPTNTDLIKFGIVAIYSHTTLNM